MGARWAQGRHDLGVGLTESFGTGALGVSNQDDAKMEFPTISVRRTARSGDLHGKALGRGDADRRISALA